jgi:hypothetical protein
LTLDSTGYRSSKILEFPDALLIYEKAAGLRIHAIVISPFWHKKNTQLLGWYSLECFFAEAISPPVRNGRSFLQIGFMSKKLLHHELLAM